MVRAGHRIPRTHWGALRGTSSVLGVLTYGWLILDLMHWISAAWERGDWSSVEWAYPLMGSGVVRRGAYSSSPTALRASGVS